jgi:hypothetical protein
MKYKSIKKQNHGKQKIKNETEKNRNKKNKKELNYDNLPSVPILF